MSEGNQSLDTHRTPKIRWLEPQVVPKTKRQVFGPVFFDVSICGVWGLPPFSGRSPERTLARRFAFAYPRELLSHLLDGHRFHPLSRPHEHSTGKDPVDISSQTVKLESDNLLYKF
jgi:hypothetical protein